MSQTSQSEQIVDDVTPDVFQLLLEFLYTDNIENISDKVTAADNTLDLIPLVSYLTSQSHRAGKQMADGSSESVL